MKRSGGDRRWRLHCVDGIRIGGPLFGGCERDLLLARVLEDSQQLELVVLSLLEGRIHLERPFVAVERLLKAVEIIQRVSFVVERELEVRSALL